MGSCFGKRQDTQGGAAELTDIGAASKTEDGTDKPSGHGKKLGVVGGEVYLPYPHKPGEAVDFGVRLDDIDGKFVLSETVENSLARNAGIYDGDVLVDINGTNIEGYQVQYLLDLLREKVKPKLLLTVKRQLDEDNHEFVWTYFEVVVENENQPEVRILYLTQTAEDVMPWINPGPLETGYSWLGVPSPAYNIYLRGNPALYLSIDDGKVEFSSTYNNRTSLFYFYIYVGPGPPDDGLVVAYSLQEFEQPVTASTTPAAEVVQSGADPTLDAMDFPDSLLGNDVPLDPRFWYLKMNVSGTGENSLQSIEQTGWYLAKSTSSNDATLSTQPQYFVMARANSNSSSSDNDC
ncbi:uncharacterized protein LOC119720121 [Patiria miniata]|uniref:PDZ domain-containing protein n=1 Tax=Patiria miniata TaxID=46514 RepID=A0A913Z4E1_PATMI|nr:uncharacterized protein LOC119720121 [Patiria miniata]XP_038045600.1 uncharacterized protein LOC119720121 [Patiria miniata]XP_038045601.1 uncharacterized protein LOC119720121 [Patiria miniata]